MNNNWYISEQGYLGFRFTDNDTVYGWIKLNTYLADKIEVYEFAIESGK